MIKKNEEIVTLKRKYLRFIYKFWSKRYDQYVEPRWYFDRKVPIEKLVITNKEKILEIGVGTGLNLSYYPAGCEVTGIDFSEDMLEKAKEKKASAKITLKLEDARSTSFTDNLFDKAIATYVLRVSPEPQRILKELSRIIKKKGLFCIVDRFKGKITIISLLHRFFLLLFGGGKDYILENLIKNSPWKIILNKPFGTRKNTRLIVLQNEKQREH